MFYYSNVLLQRWPSHTIIVQGCAIKLLNVLKYFNDLFDLVRKAFKYFCCSFLFSFIRDHVAGKGVIIVLYLVTYISHDFTLLYNGPDTLFQPSQLPIG